MTVLRLLYVVESSSGGTGRHVLDLCEQCLMVGHKVDLIYSPIRLDIRFQDNLLRLQDRGEGFKVACLDMARTPRVADLGTAWAIKQYIKANGPFDVIHCHSTKAGIVGRLGARRYRGVKVYTPHCFYSMNPEAGRLRQQIAILMERALAFFCDAIITVSNDEYQHAVSIGVPQSKLHVVHNGIESGRERDNEREKGEIRQEIGIPHDELCIGFVGRLTVQKSPETILEACAKLRSRLREGWCLVVVGDGPKALSLRSLAARLSLENRIYWLGEVEGPKVMAAFDVFALPSVAEAFPYVVLEAMAAGLPIIATRVGGIGALIQEGENGLTVAVGDSVRFSDALYKLLTDVQLRAKMGKASRERVREFSLQRMTEETLAVYQTVLTRGC